MPRRCRCPRPSGARRLVWRTSTSTSTSSSSASRAFVTPSSQRILLGWSVAVACLIETGHKLRSRRSLLKRVLLTAMVAALVIPFPARAQGKPDFSGTWTLDTAKSDPPPQGRGGGGGGATLTIKQTGTELTIQSEGRQGPQ